jgi:competence protein ComEC
MRSVDPPQKFAAYPLAQLGAAFVSGILIANGWAVATPYVIASAVVVSVLAIMTTAKQWLTCAWILMLAAFALLGLVCANVERNDLPPNQLRSLLDEKTIAVGQPVNLTGTLERDPEQAHDRVYLQLRVEKVSERDAAGVVMLLAPLLNAKGKSEFESLDLRYGARLRIKTALNRADSFRNPGVSSFTEYLDRNGFDATGVIKSSSQIEILEYKASASPIGWIYHWRTQLQRQIDSHFSSSTAGVLDAAIIGNRYNLSRDTSERFREGGTFHVLVISGLHITFLGGVAFLIARRLTRKRWLQFLCSVTLLWGYTIAVGAQSSVVRAAFMFTAVQLAPLLHRKGSSLNALAGAALVLFVIQPNNVFDPSFQLTFGSVMAIVLIAWPVVQSCSQIGKWRPTRQMPCPPQCSFWLRSFSECLFWSVREGKREQERATCQYRLFKHPLAETLERFHLQRALRFIFEALTISLSVQLLLLPPLIVYFHRVSFASLVLNIGVSVLMAAVAITAGIALVLAQISDAIAAPFVTLTNGLNWLMLHSVDPFHHLGVASIRLPEYSGRLAIVYFVYYIPLFILIVLLFRWQPLNPRPIRKRANFTKAFALAQLLLIFIVMFHPFSSGGPMGKLRIDFLDVGQGDSALITFPDSTTMLVDGGGRPGPFNQPGADFERETRSIGEAVVSEYLWWRGLDHVDYVLATHADADHIDGLNDVARNFRVGGALVARVPDADEEFKRFASTMADGKVPITLIGAGDELKIGSEFVRVLWPPSSTDPRDPSRNNDSIVLRIQHGKTVVLLTGDLEAPGESHLLSMPNNLCADVIKVPHHGSKTSSTAEFVSSVAPRYAIISVGQTSMFGHPSPQVVERWRATGAEVLTTGNSGTITVTSDGEHMNLDTFVKRN